MPGWKLAPFTTPLAEMVGADPPVVAAPGNLANQIVTGIRDENVPRAVHRDAIRRTEAGLRRRTAVAISEAAGCKRRSVSRERADDPRRIHHADPIVLRVCYVNVARAIHCHALKCRRQVQPQFCAGGGTTVAREAGRARACESCDDSFRIHLAHAIVALVREIDIPRAVHCHAGRKIQRRLGRGTAIAGESECAARDGCEHSGLIQFVDGGAIQIRDVDVPRRVRSHTAR